MSMTSSLDSRKMSGLGINFSAREPSPLTPSGLWEDDNIYAMHSPGPSPIQTSRKQSRWSESTRESRAVARSSFAESGTRSRATSDAATPGVHDREPAPSREAVGIALVQDPAESAIAARAHGRGSDDSQNSYGPLTPTDADGAAPPSLAISLSLLDSDDYLAAPRKAPLPPSPSPKATSPNVPSPAAFKGQSRRPSFSQSMMRTLSGRKKETLIPPPLELVPPVPSLPTKIELAPIVHHIELPTSLRKNSRSGIARAEHGPLSPAPPKSNSSTPSRRPSDQLFGPDGARRDSNSKTPRASFSSVFRSIRRSVGSGSERKSLNAAPLSGVLQTTSASPIGRQRITSPVVSSPLMREARAKVDRPSSQSYDFGYSTAKQQLSKHAGSRAGVAAGAKGGSPVIQRPTTAPSERMTFPSDVQNVQNIRHPLTSVPAVSRSGTKSQASGPVAASSGSPLPLLGLNLPPRMDLGIEYSNPWSSYRPTASYVSSIPISPSQAHHGAVSSRDRRRSSAAHTGTAPSASDAGASIAAASSYGRRPSRTEAALYKASVLEKAAQAGSSAPATAAISASTGFSRLSSGSGAGSRTSRCIPPMNGPPPTMELPPPPADADDTALDSSNAQGVRQLLHARSLHSLTGTGTGFGSGSATATENGGGHSFRTSLVSRSDSAMTASVFSLELSPSQPAPPSPSHGWGSVIFADAQSADGTAISRKDSRSKSIDREAEKATAPHLYLETLGATSLRNPFAPAVASSSTTLAVTSRAGSRKGSEGAAAAATASATIEYAFVRRRSSAKDETSEEGGESMRGKLVASPAMPASFRAGAGARAFSGTGHGKADSTAGPVQALSSLAPLATPTPTPAALALDEYLAGNVITPAPAFRNPFFARASQPHLLARSPSSSRRPSVALPHTATPGSSPDHPQSQLYGRKTRIQSDVSSVRRPSIASAASSSFGFPSHPTRLEVRRMTDFGSGSGSGSHQPGGVIGPRGIRVSLDTEAGEIFY